MSGAAAQHGGAATCASSSPRNGAHPVPEAAFKVGESSVEIGAHYFQKRLGLEPHLRERAARKARPPLLLSARRQPRARPRGSSWGRRAFRRCRRFSSIAGASRTCCCSRTRSWASRCSTTARVESIALDATRAHRVSCPSARRRRARLHARWVVDASGRAGLLQASARPAPAEPARRQRRVVARRRAREDRRLVRRSGVAGARAVRLALAEHEPPDGRRLLGVADPARLRQPPASASSPTATSTRSRASTASSARWTGCASSSRSARRVMEAHARRARGLSRAAALRARLRARVLAGPLGARRRGGRLHRSVLLARLRFHRDGQRLHHRPHRA